MTNTIALQVQAPDVMNSFTQGANATQGQQMNAMRMDAVRQDMQLQGIEAKRKQAMDVFSLIGSVGLGAMGGKLDGEVNIEHWVEGLDYIDSHLPGLNAASYKDKPQLAATAARASLTAMQQMQTAQNEQELEQAAQRFSLDLQKAINELERPTAQSPIGKIAADRSIGLIDDEIYDAAVTKQTTVGKPGLSATELKAVHGAEDELPVIDSSIAQLERALELNESAFSGLGASLRGTVGTKLWDRLAPDSVADPDGAAATSEYEAIMTGEAATAMSAALKGATTDRELGIFMSIIGDVSKPPAVRENAIKRLLELARAKKATAEKRIQELRGSRSEAQGGGIEFGTVEEGYRYIGGDPSDESSWEPE